MEQAQLVGQPNDKFCAVATGMQLAPNAGRIRPVHDLQRV